MTGRSPSGSQAARLSLRVETLIGIRFMAKRPSQSSACGCRPGRQRNSTAVVTAHPRAMHGNLATMEANLAPAVANAASATIMRRTGKLLRILLKHLLDGFEFRPSDRSAQRSCPHLAKPSQGWARARAMKAW
jgi:hypothetical protein